jgi:hypothetical protein
MNQRDQGVDRALVERLQQALDDVVAHRRAWEEAQDGGFTAERNRTWSESRLRLLDQLGLLKRDVSTLTGKRLVHMGGRYVDLWDSALGPTPLDSLPQVFAIRMNLLQQLEMALREALSLAKAGERVEVEARPEILCIFIAHGGRTAARDRLEKFIRGLGAEPVIVEDEPNLGLTPSAKVQREIERCHYGVILATLERAARQDDRPVPRGNIIDERARPAAELGSDRVLSFVEAGLDLPSNIAEFVRARFTQDSMDEALNASLSLSYTPSVC